MSILGISAEVKKKKTMNQMQTGGYDLFLKKLRAKFIQLRP